MIILHQQRGPCSSIRHNGSRTSR